MRVPFNGSHPVTQEFGVNGDYYKQFNLKGHNGIDYGMPIGTEIVAAITGTVIEAGWNPTGFGYYVKIENDHEGVLTAHLNHVDVAPGQAVIEGQHIALSGNTGNSTGPHLHFGYFIKPRNRSNGYDGYIDPLPHLPGGVAVQSNPLNVQPVSTSFELNVYATVTGETAQVRLAPDQNSQGDMANKQYNPDGRLHKGNRFFVLAAVKGTDPYNDGRNLWGFTVNHHYVWLGNTDLNPRGGGADEGEEQTVPEATGQAEGPVPIQNFNAPVADEVEVKRTSIPATRLSIKANEAVQAEHGAVGSILYDLSQHPVRDNEILPAGHVLEFTAYVEIDGVNYFQNDLMIEAELGINGKDLQFPDRQAAIETDSPEPVEEPTEETKPAPTVLKKGVRFLDHLSGNKQKGPQ